jgi:hypothetical protein
MNQHSPELLLLGDAEPIDPVVDLEAVLRASDDDWHWWQDDENQSAIITRQQLSTAVYVASRGDLCIRQENPGQDDICVFIRPEHVPALIRRIQQALKE